MIWLCGIIEMDIFCSPNRNFLCTIPAKKPRVGRRVDQDILGGISHFAKRKTVHYDMWLLIFSKKYP
jgi:hypothetical protein